MHDVSFCRSGGIGRRSRLKICRWQQRTGSSPVFGTTCYVRLRGVLRGLFGCLRAVRQRKTTADVVWRGFWCLPGGGDGDDVEESGWRSKVAGMVRGGAAAWRRWRISCMWSCGRCLPSRVWRRRCSSWRRTGSTRWRCRRTCSARCRRRSWRRPGRRLCSTRDAWRTS